MKVVIKNVCCRFCENHARFLIENMDLRIVKFHHGEVLLTSTPDDDQLAQLDADLRLVGMEVLQEQKNELVERIKGIIRDAVLWSPRAMAINLSDHLSTQLQYNYSYISTVFSETEGMTIRDYVISLRIERAKQLLVQERLGLDEIADRLNFSSPAHLAAQFKKITGMTTSEYKKSSFPMLQPVAQFEKLAA